MDDASLLRRFVTERAQDAFAALVERHVGMVHGVASRCLGGDEHLARDVTQAVFCDLARRAPQWSGEVRLAAWLFAATRYEANKQRRGRSRRALREQAYFAMNDFAEDEAATVDWEALRPVLDDALGDLAEADRDAVILRYFEGRDYASIGASLRVRDDAARLRVSRALEKLQRALRRRGIVSATAALGATLSAQAVTLAPAGLAASVTASAFAVGSSLGGAATAGFWLVALTKWRLVTVGVIVLAGSAGTVWQKSERHLFRGEPAIATAETLGAQVTAVTLLSPAPDAGEEADAAKPAFDKDHWARVIADVLKQKPAKAERPAPSADRIWAMTEVDRPPVLRFRAKPFFPSDLRQAGTPGEAVLEFVVARDGAVRDVTVISASHPAFGSAALAAVQHWRYAAGRVDGEPVETRMKLPIVFSISGQ